MLVGGFNMFQTVVTLNPLGGEWSQPAHWSLVAEVGKPIPTPISPQRSKIKRGWKILTAPLDPLAYMEVYSWEHINILIS